MHDIGLRLAEELAARYPTAAVRVVEHGNTGLGASFLHGERRFNARTPAGVDYRQQSFEYWLHRFTAIIDGELKK